MTRPLSFVVAMGENRVIGRDNRLIWRIKSDLKFFRQNTIGRPVIMGRKTFLSIGKPLPGRENIVLSRETGFAPEGVHVASSIDEALRLGEELADKMGADEIAVADSGVADAGAVNAGVTGPASVANLARSSAKREVSTGSYGRRRTSSS